MVALSQPWLMVLVCGRAWQVLSPPQGVAAAALSPVPVRDRGQVYNSDGTARVVVAPGGVAADAMAGAGGLELAELVPLLSPTCRHDNIIGLLGVVLDHRQQAQMLVLELAQVCHRVSPCHAWNDWVVQQACHDSLVEAAEPRLLALPRTVTHTHMFAVSVGGMGFGWGCGGHSAASQWGLLWVAGCCVASMWVHGWLTPLSCT